MSTDTFVDNSTPHNPFQSHNSYSPEAVELMRALSAHRTKTGQESSSPDQILAILQELGYRQPANQTLNAADEARRFILNLTKWQQQFEIPYPSCDDVLSVLDRMNYSRPVTPSSPVPAGLPIDRRRNEIDGRIEPEERRDSLVPSPQELLTLSREEHTLLDQLKELRTTTGRDFASSEEMLSIVWSIGYRPVGKDGLPKQWLDDDDRCRTQIAFTKAIEERLSHQLDDDFLTCRTLLKIVTELGFELQN